jgi:hypothetical protein
MEEVEMKKNCRGKCGGYPCPDTACEAFCPGPFGLWDFGNLADVLLLVCFHLFHCILAAKWWCFASMHFGLLDLCREKFRDEG